MFRYQSIDARSVYVKALASEFGRDLHGETVVIARMLDNHIGFITNLLEGKTSEEKCLKHWQILVDRARQLTRKVATLESEVTGSQRLPTKTRLRRFVSRIAIHLKLK